MEKNCGGHKILILKYNGKTIIPVYLFKKFLTDFPKKKVIQLICIHIFLMFAHGYFFEECSDFHFFFFLLERIFFSCCTIVLSIAIRQFFCMSVCLNISLGCKSCKNWSIVTKNEYVIYECNLSLYTKNCDCMLDTL